MSVPAHKVVGDVGKPGQTQYGFDREPYLKHSNVAPDITLSDYIARKMNEVEKITFDDWLSHRFPAGFENFDGNLQKDDLKAAWNAALKEGKL